MSRPESKWTHSAGLAIVFDWAQAPSGECRIKEDTMTTEELMEKSDEELAALKVELYECLQKYLTARQSNACQAAMETIGLIDEEQKSRKEILESAKRILEGRKGM